MAPDHPDISELMDRASSGDDGAFADLALATQDQLLRFAMAQGLRPADAAEAVQETLLRAYRGRERWRRGGAARPWLYAIAMNVARETRRRRGREVGGIDLDRLAAVAETSGRPGEAEDARRRLQRLAVAINALPPRQREAIGCRFLRRMSVRDTAAVMGCAEGTVKAAVFAALGNLRKRLSRGKQTS